MINLRSSSNKFEKFAFPETRRDAFDFENVGVLCRIALPFKKVEYLDESIIEEFSSEFIEIQREIRREQRRNPTGQSSLTTDI